MLGLKRTFATNSQPEITMWGHAEEARCPGPKCHQSQGKKLREVLTRREVFGVGGVGAL